MDLIQGIQNLETSFYEKELMNCVHHQQAPQMSQNNVLELMEVL